MVNPKHIEFLDKVFVRRPYFEASAYRVDKLKDVLNTNVFKNAIWLASPEFFNELKKKDFSYDLLTVKARLTALKFYNRMSFRGTPFGAFSTFGLAGWNTEGKKRKGEHAVYTLHLLLSVQQELKELQSKPFGDEILIAVNPTLYRLSFGWRYYRYEEDEKGKLTFPVYLLAYDPVDELILAQLKEKSLPLHNLVDYLIDLTDCTREEGADHITRLIDEQVLVSSNALSLLTNRGTNKQQKALFDEGLRLYDEEVRVDLCIVGEHSGKSFYAGTEMHDPMGLPVEWQQDILETLDALDLLAPIPPKNNLDKFRDTFEQKFGERSVPLLEALDPDLGVAFDNEQLSGEEDLLKGVVFNSEAPPSHQLTWTPVHRLLTKLWLQNTKRGAWDPVIINPVDLADLPRNTLPFSPSTSVFCSLHGDKLIFQNAGGATANALTGRFSAFSEDFSAFCSDVARLESEANPDLIFAELEQVSHRKLDNINRRKQVYEHVIPFNTFPKEGDILPNNIDLRVRGEEVQLVHRPTGKRIIPRLPTAFNYHHNEMPLFRFLCALQFKAIRANFDFDPEKIFPGLNFYPRIEYGRCVISLARWYLDEVEVVALVQRPLSISRLHLFCRERGVSPTISVGKGDQQLFFDLANDDEAIFFLETLADQRDVTLTESLVKSNKRVNSNDPFNSQYVVSLRNPKPVYAPLPVLTQAQSVIRNFQPGSEWIYMKIYATYQSMEQILTTVVLPWIKKHERRIKQWFFVRYYDTGSHLRLRLKVDLSDVKDLQFDLQSILNPLLVSGLVQRAYFDTYQREVERYSAQLIAEVEEVFFRGSDHVGENLLSRAGEEDVAARVWPIVHCYNMLSTFFEEGIEAIILLCDRSAGFFFREHGGGKLLKHSMDERYRQLRPALMKAISDGGAKTGSDELIRALRKLSAHALESGFNRQKLMADVIHMQVNRIFTDRQRMHETFIWHCLLKMMVSVSKKSVNTVVTLMDVGQ